MKIAVNARVTKFAMGGQQRVAAEIATRLGPMTEIVPDRPLGGMKAHAWEQFVLPVRARGYLLWSPSATGPVAMGNQVVTLHDVAFLDVPEFFSRSFTAFYKALLPVLVKRVARVVTVSEFSRQRIAATLPIDESRIDVIPNGVSRHFRPYQPHEIAATRAALDLPERYLLLQATADRRKNLAATLRAWAIAQRALDPDIALVVSGNLGRAHVFGDVAALPDVPRTKLIGYVDEAHMGPLMAGAQAFLFPSLYEGFGLPIVEAMACNTPVLTASATATGEIAGNAAMLVDATSDAAIADGIVALMRDEALRTRLAADGLLRARDFSWDSATDQYRTLFRSLGADI
ncbi:glycosyltransferase family 4 protein [Rhizobiaceae bacterium CRRU44]|uniref:Glycosyltransferase family 4 protein n=1 Tax=Ferranicluibacter rubi TaxID=2715133 RepID=A0AA43ZHL0_9HYPH|nr:glycosyltransferase family 1 protein [Ferranicluibacter rubi]NHT78043.1 glycosyltransferase family 4 protein [Ferranicluibacter rubi]